VLKKRFGKIQKMGGREKKIPVRVCESREVNRLLQNDQVRIVSLGKKRERRRDITKGKPGLLFTFSEV